MERRRPGSLTAIAVIAIIIGSLIGLRGVYTMGLLAVQDTVMRLGQIQDDPRDSPEMRERIERHRRMQREMYAVERAWKPVNWALAPLALFFGIALVSGGVLGLKLSRFGRKLLVACCGVGIGLDVLRFAVAVLITLQKSEAMRAIMSEVTADQRSAEASTNMMGAFMSLGFAFGGAWVAIKVGYYLWGLIYLTRRRVRHLVEYGEEL